ncbi:hypothetical protein [Corynebacterium cystitidis]|uniref:PIN domain-containing protein n=1 Tax=Corynebacterium cystitidis DSM 20524 TaxID=1121357 RepID=A0A1H9WAZ7_9CORY|nr:hypothetical protein [Corynebacterium cystitidis]WJY82961.1 hypothetical protein CCYS_10255 [Corynebacterium cystitidis DSM 20524]SES31112.1 hypothetical protein SAMN05661109_02644 [Corynebacterium cystitidis DSM 20524]SNV68150.1 Uncharacterised protein [Corynebacterium cystitidis]
MTVNKPPILFIDTSILTNLLNVPGKNQDRAEVNEDFKLYRQQGAQFILPITAVIETGNHIAHLPDGKMRREIAEKFRAILQQVVDGKTPWLLHDFDWDKDFLKLFLAGASSGSSYVELAVQQVGAGDLCILTEKDIFARKDIPGEVEVWTLDHGLDART